MLAEHIRHYGTLPDALLQRLIEAPRLTAIGLKERLGAYQQHPDRLKAPSPAASESPSAHAKLKHYGVLNGHANGQGESHVVH